MSKIGLMRSILTALLLLSYCDGGQIDDFITKATEKHGPAGTKAAGFLVEHMPAPDRESLTENFLTTHLDLAFQARSEFPWTARVPEDVFLNDVLPYAVFDETRDTWRADFLEKARPLVKEAKTTSEAAQALNREFFKLIKVHYNTGRKNANQSAMESIASGKASCTGLSIILVDACRAVGIPARAVGTPMWSNGLGNHTWVEIWDDGWHFAGADEYDPQGLNRGWFINDAAQAKIDDPKHSIYATSWKRERLAFPLIWAQGNHQVAAVNVTASYAKPTANKSLANLGVRLFAKKNGDRMAAWVSIMNGSGLIGAAETKAGTADLNDMPRFEMKQGASGRLFFTMKNVTREWPFGPLNAGDSTMNAFWDELKECSPEISALHAWLKLPTADRQVNVPALQAPLSIQDAAIAVSLLGGDRSARLAIERKAEFEKKTITHDDKILRWLEKTFGETPADGHSLWISMHGGGGAPAAVNDGQWKNQIQLYEPAEGIYIAPRAPTDTWNLWHEGHIDPMFQRLIEDYVILRGVNPNKVYLMGYSAGGDGVWQLAPRMADRFAAAAMMAGHPNESSLLGLRNIPFAIYMGANDAAYKRNEIAVIKIAEMQALQNADPDGYVHRSKIYEGLGHWMNRKDAEAVPWMAEFQRNTWPKKVVWFQDDITHDRFYWLKIPDKTAAKAGQQLTATVDGQNIRLDGDVPAGTSLLLSDALLDLDRELTVFIQGKPLPSKKIPRTAGSIRQSLEERLDLPATATAIFVLP